MCPYHVRVGVGAPADAGLSVTRSVAGVGAAGTPLAAGPSSTPACPPPPPRAAPHPAVAPLLLLPLTRGRPGCLPPALAGAAALPPGSGAALGSPARGEDEGRRPGRGGLGRGGPQHRGSLSCSPCGARRPTRAGGGGRRARGVPLGPRARRIHWGAAGPAPQSLTSTFIPPLRPRTPRLSPGRM